MAARRNCTNAFRIGHVVAPSSGPCFGHLTLSALEIIAVMRAVGDHAHGCRRRVLILIPWRYGLRIQEVLAPAQSDLEQRRGSLLV